MNPPVSTRPATLHLLPTRQAGAAMPCTAAAAQPTAGREIDALDLLSNDHDAVMRLFRDYERRLRHRPVIDDKELLVGQICSRLSIHLQIEEELFYPAARELLGPEALLEAALCDHGETRELIARLDEMDPAHADHDRAVAVLEAHVVPHMRDEEARLFPQLRRAGLDTASVGLRISLRRRALHEDVTRIGLPKPASHAGAGRARAAR